jgi:two-component sensor histidine kinase
VPPSRGGKIALALALVGAAVLARLLLLTIAPDIPFFVILLPTIVFSGAVLGTHEGILAAAVGCAAFATLFIGPRLFARPLTKDQLDILLFGIASASVLWATHRQRAATAAAAFAEARLAEVFRQLPGAAAIIEGPDGAFLIRSDQSTDILGHVEKPVDRVEDMAGYYGVFPDGRRYEPGDYPIVRALTSGAIVTAEPLLYRQPSGRLIDLEVYARPVRIDGRIVAAVGMAFDVTERREAERLMRESEARARAMSERLRAALEAGALGTWELDLATQTTRLDAQMAALLGLPPKAVTLPRADLGRFFEPEDRDASAAVFERALREGGAYVAEMRGRTIDGEPRWFVLRGAILAGDGKGVGVLQDMTDARRRESALRDALRSRELLMREADHRIKNSLQLVVSLLHLQAHRLDNADAKAALRGAMARIGAIADAHVAFQESQSFDTIAVDRMLGELCQRLGALDPAITMRFDPAETIALVSDQAIPLGLMVSELVTNALRHAFPQGAGGLIRVAARRVPGAILVEVADDGRGLPDATRRRGLGTTIIDALRAKTGAAVAIDSAPGAGTRVTITMPAPDAPDGGSP